MMQSRPGWVLDDRCPARRSGPVYRHLTFASTNICVFCARDVIVTSGRGERRAFTQCPFVIEEQP